MGIRAIAAGALATAVHCAVSPAAATAVKPGSEEAKSSASPLRTAPFAAIIPGDSVAEAVLTQGLSSFLNLFNAAIIFRLICTWFPDIPQNIVSPFGASSKQNSQKFQEWEPLTCTMQLKCHPHSLARTLRT